MVIMWECKYNLLYPVKITKPDLKSASIIYAQIGGYAGELGAALRYFMQIPTMPTKELKTLLYEIATEEMAHVEILVTLVSRLTKDLTPLDFKRNGCEKLYAERGKGVYAQNQEAIPFNALTFQSTGDVVADISEDIAAEEKARAVYEHLMDLIDNTEVLQVLQFLRQREIVHLARFKDALAVVKNMKK